MAEFGSDVPLRKHAGLVVQRAVGERKHHAAFSTPRGVLGKLDGDFAGIGRRGSAAEGRDLAPNQTRSRVRSPPTRGKGLYAAKNTPPVTDVG